MPTTILAIHNQKDPIINNRLRSLTIDWNINTANWRLTIEYYINSKLFRWKIGLSNCCIVISSQNSNFAILNFPKRLKHFQTFSSGKENEN